MEWNKEKTLYFIEKYKEETLLWNPAHPEHYNKLKKEDAWDRLASLLDSEREACKKKMTSLLASFRREKQKTKQSTGTGKGKMADKVVPVVKAEEPEEEEVELVDPQKTLRDGCSEKKEAQNLWSRYQECNDRVNSRSNTAEICDEELFDWVEAVDKCVAKDILKHLK